MDLSFSKPKDTIKDCNVIICQKERTVGRVRAVLILGIVQ